MFVTSLIYFLALFIFYIHSVKASIVAKHPIVASLSRVIFLCIITFLIVKSFIVKIYLVTVNASIIRRDMTRFTEGLIVLYVCVRLHEIVYSASNLVKFV